jgi:hypothetical protein
MDYMEIPRLRLERAAEHINQFCIEADAFLKTKPFGFVTEYYTEDGKDFVKFLFRVYHEPPKRLGIIAGDCIHNLRATLDNIAWSLGRVYPTTDPNAKPDKLAFPVCYSYSNYRNKLQTPNFKAINDFPPDVQVLIESMQPYNSTSPSAFFLSQINKLSNTDKHKTPDLMGGNAHGVTMKGYNLQQPASMSAGLAVLDGKEFARGAIPEGGISKDAQVELSIDVAFHVRGAVKGGIARYFLINLYQFIRDEVITQFEPFLPKN